MFTPGTQVLSLFPMTTCQSPVQGRRSGVDMPLFVEASELSWNVRTVLDKKDMSAWSRTATVLNEVALAGRTKQTCLKMLLFRSLPENDSRTSKCPSLAPKLSEPLVQGQPTSALLAFGASSLWWGLPWAL